MAVATYAIRVTDGYTGAVKERSGTLDELTQSFSFILEMGKRYDSGIDMTPKTAQSLAESLQKAAAADMSNKSYEFVGETKRVPYWDWKNCFPECATVKGSYDAKRGTIEMVLPYGIMESHEKFSRREWEKLDRLTDLDCCNWRLKGTGIKVGWSGSGVCAYYYVSATPPDSGKLYFADGSIYRNDPELYVTLHMGYGPAARDKAIIKARELAETELYNL